MSALADTMGAGYFQRALLEAVLVGLACGAVGVHVVLRRLPFFAMAVSHAMFPGVVLAALAGLSIYLGGIAFGAVFAVLVVLGGARRALDDTSAIGIGLAAAFALGVVLLAVGAPTGRNLAAFMVGSILTVDAGDLRVAAAVALLSVGVVGLMGKELTFGAFDPEVFMAMGYRRRWTDLVMMVLISVVVVTALPAVGTLLVVSLLTVPAMTARLWCDRVGPITALAAVLGAIVGVLGLCASVVLDVAPGGAIALTASALYVTSMGVVAAGRWAQRQRGAMRA